MKPLLLFDCFGVIYDEIAPIVLKDYYGEEIKNRIRKEIFPSMDNGDISFVEGLTKIVERFGGSVLELQERWKKGTVLRLFMVSRIRELRKNYRLVLISNAPSGIVENLFASNGLAPYFEGIYSSSALHMKKPDPKFFEYVYSRHNKEGERTYFIDDTEANFAGIQNLPIEGILFRGIESLDVL